MKKKKTEDDLLIVWWYFRWCILSILLLDDENEVLHDKIPTKHVYSQLHLALLNSLMEGQNIEVTPTHEIMRFYSIRTPSPWPPIKNYYLKLVLES